MPFGEITCDIWELELSHYIVIPVNNGGVMGRGLAAQAADKYPQQCQTDAKYRRTRAIAKTVKIDAPLIFFPVKHAWFEDASVELITLSCQQLVSAIQSLEEKMLIALPELGCGFGRLRWEQVRPILEQELEQVSEIIILVKPAPDLAKKYPRAFKPAAKPYWIKQATE